MTNKPGYGQLLKDGGFEAFLWTQFLGAFNDNVFKMIVSVFAVSVAAGGDVSARNLALAGAVFVIPFLLFAGWAGHLADKFSKTRVLQVTKAFEMSIMLLGTAALLAGRMDLLLVALFLLAAQANFFSPAKYGILPEMLSEAQITRANGLLELTTFIAIVIGSSFGTFLYARWQHAPLRMGLTMMAIAVAGSLASLRIRKVPAAPQSSPFRWNPFHEIIEGTRALAKRKPMALAVWGISWFWFVGGLFQMALLVAGAESLHVSGARAGLLITALAAGIGLGSLAAGALSGDYIELALVPAGSLLMGLGSLGLGVTAHYGFAICFLVVIGFGGGLFAVPLNAYLQEAAGAAEKGRILATNNFFNMLGVIAASGVLWLLHDRLLWHAGAIIFALGALMLAGSLYLAARMPEIVVRFALWCLANLLFRIRIEGAENIPRTGAALLAANHVSYADAVLVGYSSRRRTVHFLMWQPIFDIPIANYFFRVLQAIPIGVESPKATIRALRTARGELERGELVGIFPEGAISRTGEIQNFERGFEKILQGTDAPVIPMRIEGLWGHPLSFKGGRIFGSWERAWRPRVTIRIGRPVHGGVSGMELQQAVVELANGTGVTTWTSSVI